MTQRSAGDELASLVLLCCNELEYTRACLDSVLAHTRPPYELILVDNGSADGTPAYLDALRRRPGPERVAVLRNDTNRGFAAGCNQGLAEARGQYLVLLNNDTVVPPGWLDGLIRWAQADGPAVGLVGPVTNSSRPPQQIPVAYQSPAGMPAFAARRRQEFAGQALRVERLTGFCLLVRREVLEKLGGLDEGYGVGFFEDDDLCVRAVEAGYRLLVALDVFVHHAGSRTFAGLGLDTGRLLRDNFEVFRTKWGEKHAAGYRLPAPPPVPGPNAAANNGRPRVSLCMMVKNEEANLPGCLDSVADLVDEIVIVDTGSTDATKQVAQRYGARVVDFPWRDSFAAARNEALRHATGRWAFWMDADDRLDDENRERLKALFASMGDEPDAYVMRCRCLPGEDGVETVVHHARLFPVHPDVRWDYRVHEQILPAVLRRGGKSRFSDVVIRHGGYTDPALHRRKLERNLRLLKLEQAERPDDPFTLFNLGSLLQELGRAEEAAGLFRRSITQSDPKASIVRKLYALLAQCERRLGDVPQALATCRAGAAHYPDDPELLLQESLALGELGDADGAIACLERLLQTPAADYLASVDAGLRGYLARSNLAASYAGRGRDAEALEQWQVALAENPGHVPAWVGLGEFYLSRGRLDALAEAATRLEQIPAGRVAGLCLRGRALLARNEFGTARRLLEAARAEFPGAPGPCVYLSHALLQEGRDWGAAEEALRAVLRLDPDDRTARRNLGVLLRQFGRPGEAEAVEGPTLTELYRQACDTPSDIHEHCPTLAALARECRHVTEFGTRAGVSTTALLYAQPGKLVCYDKLRLPQVDRLAARAGRTEFVFRQADVLAADIEETDLLFIDTCHVYEQLQAELRRHAGQVRQYLVLHDTTTFGWYGEQPGHAGLWPAVEEFLNGGEFRLQARYANNHGLTVLGRVV